MTKSLETLMDHVGVLYKFHDRPITYLYNTLHYYERRVRDRPSLKRKLISSITGGEIVNFCLPINFAPALFTASLSLLHFM